MRHSINLKKIACTAFAVGLLGAGAWGCGDDTAEDDAPAAGMSAAVAGGTTGGAGGTTGGAGGTTGGAGGTTGGSGGSGGMPATKMCGTATCMGGMLQGQMSPPCCDEDSGNVCGLTVDAMTGACEGLMQPGDPDPSCPTELSVITTELVGCCKPDGKCGVISTSLMGCIERTDLPPAFLMGAPMTPALTAMDCGGGDADGGI
jgi:hypothetical protein